MELRRDSVFFASLPPISATLPRTVPSLVTAFLFVPLQTLPRPKQSVRESNYAWHAVGWNTYMFGTEHEGFVSNPAWFTEAMYQSSASLHRRRMRPSPAR